MGYQEDKGRERFRIGLYGRRGSGKSALIKALTGRPSALARALHRGDVEKAYQTLAIKGIGEIDFSEAPGADSVWKQGSFAQESLAASVREIDMALVLFREADMHGELIWYNYCREAGKPVIPVISRVDALGDGGRVLARIVEQKTGQKPLCVSAMIGDGLKELRDEIEGRFSEVFGGYAVKGDLVGEGELVLLVIPQEVRGAVGKERLPYFKVFCELLSRRCLVLGCTPEMLGDVLQQQQPPKLIIADNEYLDKVRALKPAESMLTSFAVLGEDSGEETEGKE